MGKKFNNDNFMDYPEFQFWFMRFLAGNFDLDYDRSQDPKYRTITELPLELFEKVCEKLGDNYQNKYRFTLRHVCKSFRSLVDSWIPTFKRISIYSCTTGSICVTCDSKTFEYKNENLAVDDLTSILIHPKLKLNRIDTWKDERFAEKLVRKLEPLKIKNIHVEKIDLNYRTWELHKRLLPFYRAETLKMVHDGLEKDTLKLIEEIYKFDQEQRGADDDQSITFSNMTINCYFPHVDEVTTIIKKLLQFSNLKYCQLTHLNRNVQWKVHIQQFGAKIQSENPNILHYSIPNSNDFFEIEVQQKHGIRIKRKSA
ncbi:unnamed protein product [Caenorhabditis nigoni]